MSWTVRIATSGSFTLNPAYGRRSAWRLGTDMKSLCDSYSKQEPTPSLSRLRRNTISTFMATGRRNCGSADMTPRLRPSRLQFINGTVLRWTKEISGRRFAYRREAGTRPAGRCGRQCGAASCRRRESSANGPAAPRERESSGCSQRQRPDTCCYCAIRAASLVARRREAGDSRPAAEERCRVHDPHRRSSRG